MAEQQQGPLGPGDRHVAREVVMKALYERDVAQGDPLVALGFLAGEDGVGAADQAVAERMLAGVLAHLPDIDRRIAGYARDWRLSRLAAVDRNVLRLGVYELCHDRSAPVSVCINEAVDLANRFGSEASAGFVNGVLGQLARDLQAEASGAHQSDG